MAIDLRCTITSATSMLGQVEHAAQHAPVAALHRAFGVVVLDRAADLLVRGQHVGAHVQVDAEQAQRAAHDPLDGVDHRPQQPHHQQHRAGERARHVVGADDGQGLGQHLDEHHHQHGHHAGGDGDAPGAGDHLGDEHRWPGPS